MKFVDSYKELFYHSRQLHHRLKPSLDTGSQLRCGAKTLCYTQRVTDARIYVEPRSAYGRALLSTSVNESRATRRYHLLKRHRAHGRAKGTVLMVGLQAGVHITMDCQTKS